VTGAGSLVVISLIERPISQPRTGNHCHYIRIWVYPDIAIRDFAIGEKVSGRSQKQFLFWDLRSKKAIADWCRVGGCRLQDEVEYLKVEL
jgi:hypothetical protein